MLKLFLKLKPVMHTKLNAGKNDYRKLIDPLKCGKVQIFANYIKKSDYYVRKLREN
jgi:hypothetical protein